MNRKVLVVLLILIVITLGGLILLRSGSSINNNLPVQSNSGENLQKPEESGTSIDINLSGDEDEQDTNQEEQGSGEVAVSGENKNESNENEVKPSGDLPDNNLPEEKENAVNKETGNFDLVSDETKMVFKISPSQIKVYYCQDDKIVGLDVYIDYLSPENAKSIADMYNDGTLNIADVGNIKSVSYNGKYVVMTYNESEYEIQKPSVIQSLYKSYEVK